MQKQLRPVVLAAAVVASVALALAWRGGQSPVGDLPARAQAAPYRAAPASQEAPTLRFERIASIEGERFTRIDARNGTIYVIDSSSGLVAYDVSDPSSPKALGSATAEDAIDLVLDGELVLVTAPGTVTIFDVSDPRSLRRLGQLALGFPERGLAGRGGLGLIAVAGGIAVVDYSVPEAPREIGRVEAELEGITGLALAGDRAYVHARDRFGVIDIADPEQPVLRGSLEASAYTRRAAVAVEGVRAFLGERVHGAVLIPPPVTFTPGPSPTGTRPAPTPAATAPPDVGRLTVVDVSDPNRVTVEGRSAPLYSRPIRDLHVAGRFVWAVVENAAGGWAPPVVLDVSDPTRPIPVRTVFTPSLDRYRVLDVVTEGDIVFLVGEQGVDVYRRQRAWASTVFLPSVLARRGEARASSATNSTHSGRSGDRTGQPASTPGPPMLHDPTLSGAVAAHRTPVSRARTLLRPSDDRCPTCGSRAPGCTSAWPRDWWSTAAVASRSGH